MKHKPIIVWFRQDLRLHDNPALAAAAQKNLAIIPLFIWSPEEEGTWTPGAASRWWLHQSLKNLNTALQEKGSRLTLCKGRTLESLEKLIVDTNACAVYWNRRYEPDVINRDKQIKEKLKQSGLDVQSFNSALLCEPWQIKNKSGQPFRVFTPFWKTVLTQYNHQDPLPAPSKLEPPPDWPKSLSIRDLELEPKINWAGGLR